MKVSANTLEALTTIVEEYKRLYGETLYVKEAEAALHINGRLHIRPEKGDNREAAFDNYAKEHISWTHASFGAESAQRISEIYALARTARTKEKNNSK